MRGWMLAAIAALIAVPAGADPIAITKSVKAVSDADGNAASRLLPGVVADYRTVATNNAGTLTVVRGLLLTEPLPAGVVLRVVDLATAGKGPVELSDVNLLGTGLLSSGLTLSYSASSPASDGVEFYDGSSWAYQPVPDATGYDPRVRAIRVTLNGTFASGASFQLRYRVKIR